MSVGASLGSAGGDGVAGRVGGEQLRLAEEPALLRQPPRIGSALEADSVSARPAAAARLEDTVPLSAAAPARPTAGAPTRVLIPAREPEPADWPRLFGPHIRLGKIAAAIRRELREAVPTLALPEAQPWSDQRTGEAAADLVAALAHLDDAYDQGACASRPLVTAVRWHLIRTLADLLRDLHDELAELADIADRAEVPHRRREQPLDPAAFALIKALCSAACQRISALAKELTTQLAVEGQRRSPLWNAVRRLQRAADAVSVLCVGTPSRYAAARTALESQLTAMRAA